MLEGITYSEKTELERLIEDYGGKDKFIKEIAEEFSARMEVIGLIPPEFKDSISDVFDLREIFLDSSNLLCMLIQRRLLKIKEGEILAVLTFDSSLEKKLKDWCVLLGNKFLQKADQTNQNGLVIYLMQKNENF